MNGYAMIRAVGKTLVSLLQEEMTLVDDNEVALTSPAELDGQTHPRVTLFLYRVSKNGHLQNAERPATGDVQPRQPLTVDLHYFLTTHPRSSRNTPMTVTEEQHTVLGEAMQVFHDHGTLSGSQLKEALEGGREIHITMADESTEELTNIWSTFEDHPFRVSVSYEVGPVEIASTDSESLQRVVETEQSTGLGNTEDADE